MKFSLLLVAGVVVLSVIVSGGLPFQGSNKLARTAEKSEKSIRGVADLLAQATEKGGPGRRRASGRWAARLTAACATREEHLAALARPNPRDTAALAHHADSVLAIHRAYARRLAALRAPSGFAADLRQIRRHTAEQEQALAQVAATLHAGDVSRASREARPLRELAGRANPLLTRLGLEQCALRPSGMPL